MDEPLSLTYSSHNHAPKLKRVGEDISEQQLALDALRESEARFRTLAECASVVVRMTDANNSCTYISKYWRECVLGLVRIQERARMIGAHIEIRSLSSQGTTVELRVPTSTVAP